MIPVLVRYVPDHDSGPRVLLSRFGLRRLGVAGDLRVLEQETRLPPTPPAFPITTTAAAAATDGYLLALFT
jgi:hypothetical protein